MICKQSPLPPPPNSGSRRYTFILSCPCDIRHQRPNSVFLTSGSTLMDVLM